MKILGIETSCDETAVSIISGTGSLGKNSISVKVLGNNVLSQIALHEEYGGVVPMLAKREHSKNLIPILRKTLKEAGLLKMKNGDRDITRPDKQIKNCLEKIFEREPELLKQFLEFIPHVEKPDIDAIAVTYGPGLEPALWVGINFAKALSLVFDIPVIPMNHMEGHVFAALLRKKESGVGSFTIPRLVFPAITLLVSGAHTELVLMTDWFTYGVIGKTRDDAVGEAFDKVARILGRPYPGGPEISRLADEGRLLTGAEGQLIKLPRPMIRSNDYDFSFSGLKTAVLYLVKKLPNLTDDLRRIIARAFEDAVIDVLTGKTRQAITEFDAKTLILGGGVSANKRLRESLRLLTYRMKDMELYVPEISHSTDNALMIAAAGYARLASQTTLPVRREITASGNLRIG